jgi:CPA1 family monovalent cation:H+ antiporter
MPTPALSSISLVLIMLLAVVLSSMIMRAIPVPVPLPLVQIAFGSMIGLSTNLRLTLNPDVFFLLFLPPLLFLGGWRTSREHLLQEKIPILHLAIGLVVFTVLGLGFAVHWIVPAMPLPVAFALASVLSPTDALAVSAIAERCAFPPRLLRVIEGEALLNDASGLVCLRFAIAAALTGTFSLPDAAGAFLWLALGGAATGIVVTAAIAQLKLQVSRVIGEDTGNQILISTLIPFAAYLIAEHLGCSSILAAVTAGMAMNWVEAQDQVLAITRVRRRAVWDTLQVALNGIIFVLLGEQLPAIVGGAAFTVEQTGHRHRLWLLVYIAAIGAILWLSRFAWAWIFMRLTRRQRGGVEMATPVSDWRLTMVTSFAGVRGAVTLAGILTLPLTMPDGSSFPARDLAICLAAGAILLSMLLAGTVLPVLLRRVVLPPEPSDATERQARITAATAAIRAIEEAQHQMARGRVEADVYAEAAARIMASYRRRIDDLSRSEALPTPADKASDLDQSLRLTGLQAERSELVRLVRTRAIGDETMRKLMRELDLVDALVRTNSLEMALI